MTRISIFTALAFFIGTFALPISAQTKHEANLKINIQEETNPVPAGLYGIFMEELSHAFDGGIYAELIQNRSFEEGVLPPGMKLVENEDGSLRMELEKLPAGVPEENWNMPWPWNGNCGWDPERALIGWSLRDEDGGGSMKLTADHPMNQASSLSLELNLENNVNGNVSLLNGGYWGINIQKGVNYDLKFYLRPGTFRGNIKVDLEDENQNVLSSHSFNDIQPSTDWKKYTASLSAEGSSTNGKLSITFIGTGKLQIDWVSLFPPTFLNRENGLRPDLAQYLADLKPDFVRYPGGCYVQGLSWESAPDWRKMVCPPEERPGMWGYWKYRSTDGFGYHEFLQFCEDIGSDAMYVSFAGMTVHPDNNWPLEDIDTLVQHTLDAIEYALGPVDSKWGAVRNEMGHPEPFPLKYVEIGNEHPPAIYGDYYVKFRQAIKEKYPDITVIMSMFWSGLNRPAIERAGDENIDMVDEHSYREANWIRANYDYFDNYKRTPWTIYVGEYAAHHSNGDLFAGLGDAAYLMMMERNGDLVKMASYAPLFVNVNAPSWGVNLIEFDAARSFAHASYYAQKTFNENRPDVNLELSTTIEPRPDTTIAGMAGKFGLGTFNTHSEFKDLKVFDKSGNLVFSDDFSDLKHWDSPGKGSWKIKDNILSQEDTLQGPTLLTLKDLDLKTGRITLKARKIEGKEGFVLFFNISGENRFIFGNYGAAGNAFSSLEAWGSPEGYSFKVDKRTQGAIKTNHWYDLELVVNNNSAEMYLDGEKISNARLNKIESFFTAAGYNKEKKSLIVKAVNYNAEPVKTLIDITGKSRIGKKAKHITISSEGIYDQNTLENPEKIVPHEKNLKIDPKNIVLSIPPYSVNLIEIPVKRK